jgi:rhamnose utilization protein RhaD (predicted bifunctional aldolase and dehydrogenase)
MTASLFATPTNRWQPQIAGKLSGVDEVIYRSNLLGVDDVLVREGGGNFSAKGTTVDHRGRTTSVLWMSAWGCDSSTTIDDFPALRLDDLLAVRSSGPMTDTEMVEYQAACGLRGRQAASGIETLTHAFIPAKHVDHTHPDAVIALTSVPRGRELAEKEFGDEAIWFDYRQYDVDVARELADRVAANPLCRFILLANHGLFTWADTSEQCYLNSLEAAERCITVIERELRGPANLGGPAVSPLAATDADDVLAEHLPRIRGLLSTGAPGLVLHVDRAPDTVDFVSSIRGPMLSERGPACPDHLVTVGYRPAVLPAIGPEEEAGAQKIADAIDRHRRWYHKYYAQNAIEVDPEPHVADTAPRALLMPGIGVVSAGPEAAKARLISDHFRQSMIVIRATDAVEDYGSLSEAQGVADEYWPLMRYKPQLRPPDGVLMGKIFLLAGTDDELMAEVATRLAAADAHVALAASDAARAADAAAEIVRARGERRAVALPSHPGEPGSVVRDTVLSYGGLDVLIDLTGAGQCPNPYVVAATPVFERQGRGGSILLVDRDRPSEELAAATLDPDAVPGVTINAVRSGDPDEIASAAMYFADHVTAPWNGLVLSSHRADSEGTR